MFELKRLLTILLIFLILVGCSNNAENGDRNESQINSTQEATAIVLSTNSINIQVDENFKLDYTILPKNAENITVSWRSADDSIVSVDDTGVVVGIGEGQTNVIAECENGVYAVCPATVMNTEESAYDGLSDKEKEFVDLFVSSIDIFYDPSSVSIKYYHTLNSRDSWDITVLAHNKMGSFSEQDYIIDSSGNLTQSIFDHVIMPDWEEECNLDLINQAIKERVG